jgi:ribosome biogenesis GTP-binding protein YsxC/EngB
MIVKCGFVFYFPANYLGFRMFRQVLNRSYHSKRMRAHQSNVARLDNVFRPIESMFEDSQSPSSGRYAEKREEEKFTRPQAYIAKYIESSKLGSPKTKIDFRAMVNHKPLAALFLDRLKPRVKFIGSAINESELPLAILPEIAVVGRSNSGKSTLINALSGTRCCQVRDKPGSTQVLSFYNVGDPPLLCFVDIPGFGFAYADPVSRKQWTEFALWYLKSRKNLRCVLLVTDARHGLADSDLELLSFLKKSKIEYKVVLNKCDLVEAGSLAKRLTVLGKDLDLPPSNVLSYLVPVSALRLQGIEKLRSICEGYKLKRDVVIGGKERKVIDLLEERRLKKTQIRLQRKDQKQDEDDDLKCIFEEKGTVSGGRRTSRNRREQSCFELEPEAYKPEPTSILKRATLVSSMGDINVLAEHQFVSQDEVENLGLRGGKHKRFKPHGAYEEQMKLEHELDWKMRLDLEPIISNEPEGGKRDESEADVSALGFISTFNPVSIPKGTDKWKVFGMKPRTKTSRAKPKPDTAKSIAQNRKQFIR